MAAYRRVYDSWLTAKNRDQFQNPTLGNRVWATFLSVRGMGQTRRTDKTAGRTDGKTAASLQLHRRLDKHLADMTSHRHRSPTRKLNSSTTMVSSPSGWHRLPLSRIRRFNFVVGDVACRRLDLPACVMGEQLLWPVCRTFDNIWLKTVRF